MEIKSFIAILFLVIIISGCIEPSIEHDCLTQCESKCILSDMNMWHSEKWRSGSCRSCDCLDKNENIVRVWGE